MAIEVTMPKLSDTMEEGRILKWLKAPGDRVAVGEALAEVETDKATMELEAYDAGVLAEVRVAEGDSAPVGAVIAVLPDAAKPASQAAKPAPAPAKPAAPARPAPAAAPKSAPPPPARESETRRPTAVRRPADAPPAGSGEVRASPLARRIARERGVDL